METVSGPGNWRLSVRRERDGIVILGAVTCDRRAVLPETLFGLPVTALGHHALTPGRPWPRGEEVLVTWGPQTGDWDNRNLEDLALPSSLGRVGDYALLNCGALKTLRLHGGPVFWGGAVLMNCRSLDTLHLTRTGPEQGETLAWFAGELSRELDVTVEGPGGTARLLFPEYTELYEENCPAHHFDYFISGAGYPYHHCFHQKKLNFKDYDALWPGFLSMEHDGETALRLAWYRLRWPMELGAEAETAYLDHLRSRLAEALVWLAGQGDSAGLRFLLDRAEPDRAALSAACARARAREAPALVALLLEEQHRRFPQKSADRFLL